MTKNNTIDFLGFNKAISTNSNNECSEDRSDILGKVKRFGVDAVYFNIDENKNSFPAIFLKKVELFDNDTLKNIVEIQKKSWNYKKVLFLYVYSDTEIRIYNCSERPILVTKEVNFDYNSEIQKIEIKRYKFSDKKELEQLNQLFSTISIDTGVIWTLEEADFIREKINLQRKVDKYLVSSLVSTAKQLKNKGLEIDFIHKIILRSLFLLYLEDRGATDTNFYSEIKEGAKSYFDILDDVTATYSLFEKLEDYFNGNIFTFEEGENITKEQLQLIKKCFTSGNEDINQLNLFEGWRLFDFSIIQIELLSEIYESFLNETDPELKKKTGTYYTPPSLVEFILNQKLPTNAGQEEYNIKVLDPSCGSGIFLVESFKRLVKRYENCHKEKLTDFETLKTLLTDNIFGIELHSQAIKVTAFSLYLSLVDKLNPKTIWQSRNYRLPNLINNPNDKTLEEQGRNLFCRDAIEENEEIEQIEFDLVVGNPPFGTKELPESIKTYCSNENFAKEMVLPFLHKSTEFASEGEIALIFNTKVLTNTGGTYCNFRNWLFNECYVEKVFNFSILRNAPKNFGGQLFGNATGPISIVFYQKEQPENPLNKIFYYAPKTYIKSNIIEGLSIDHTDLKYLPREECQNPKSKIWKVAMWGGRNDWKLISKLECKYESLRNKLDNENWHYATGLNADAQKLEFTPERIIDTKGIKRYYTDETAIYNNSKLYRGIDTNLFNPPFVVIKQAQKNREICASYIDYQAFCLNSTYIINGEVDINSKKILVSIINSKFVKYYLFMVASSWGIERERITFKELLSIPYLSPNKKDIKGIVENIDFIIENKKHLLTVDISEYENNIDNIISNNIFNLNNIESQLLEDTLNYNLDLFEKQEKSIALLPTQQEQVSEFATLLCDELNNFLGNEDLFANAIIYKVNRFTPLMMIKISFDDRNKKLEESNELIDDELQKLDKFLWQKEATNIYFRKKLNYKKGNNIFIIRPNQKRFWIKSMALEDSSELILEILNGA